MRRAGSLLSPLIKRLGLDNDVRLARIRADWQDLFDKPLSLHMSPSRLLEGDLLLSVDSPAWLQQLTFYKKEITAKLARYGVKDVRFRIGRIIQNDRRTAPKAVAELTPEDLDFVSDVVSPVADETIRDSIRSAVEKSLLRAKSKE